MKEMCCEDTYRIYGPQRVVIIFEYFEEFGPLSHQFSVCCLKLSFRVLRVLRFQSYEKHRQHIVMVNDLNNILHFLLQEFIMES